MAGENDLELTDMTPVTAGNLQDGDFTYIAREGSPGLDRSLTVAELAKAVVARTYTATAYTPTIPLDAQRLMAPKVVDAAIAFTPGSSPKEGATCSVRLTASGVTGQVPSFSGFTKWHESRSYLNGASKKNLIKFWYVDGTPYYMIGGSATDFPFEAGGVTKVVLIGVTDSIFANAPTTSALVLMPDQVTTATVIVRQERPLCVAGEKAVNLASTSAGSIHGQVTNMRGRDGNGYALYYDPQGKNIWYNQRFTNDIMENLYDQTLNSNAGGYHLPNSSQGVARRAALMAIVAGQVQKQKDAGGIVIYQVPSTRRFGAYELDGSFTAHPNEANFQTHRLNIIADIVAGATTADAICRVDQIAELQDVTNRTYLPDGLHWSNSAHLIALPTIKATLLQVIADFTARKPAQGTITLSAGLYAGGDSSYNTSGTVNGLWPHETADSEVSGLTFDNGNRTWFFHGQDNTTPTDTDIAEGIKTNLWGDKHWSSIRVNSGSAPIYARLPHSTAPLNGYVTTDGVNTKTVGAMLLESGDFSSGFTYTPMGVDAGGNDAAFVGWDPRVLPANVSGKMRVKVGNPISTGVGYFKALLIQKSYTGNSPASGLVTPPAYNGSYVVSSGGGHDLCGLAFFMDPGNPGSPFWNHYRGYYGDTVTPTATDQENPTASVLAEVGDLIEVEVERQVSGGLSNVYGRVSKNGGTTFTLVWSKTNVSLGKLSAYFETAGGGVIEKPILSTGWVADS